MASRRPPQWIGRVFGYWRAERRTIRHGLVSLVVATVGEVAAGIALGAMTGTLEKLPGLLILLPAANSIRGSIFGALSSRLGTSIHTGLFEPTTKREGVLFQNMYSATVLTFSVSLMLGVLAKGVALALGIPTIGVLDLVVISVLGGVASSVIVGVLSVVLALAAHSYRWDLDSVATPVITAIGDMVTIPALYGATFVVSGTVGVRYLTPAITVVVGAASLWMTAQAVRSRLPQARRAVRESLPILVATGTLSLLAGVVVQSRADHFLTYPALLVLIPPLLSNTGALAASLSSRLASKLHLGAIEPKAWPQGLAFLDSSIVLLFSVWVFALVAIAAHFGASFVHLASPGLIPMLEVGVLAGLIATTVLVVIAYYIAIATYRIGLDPDNHGVPVVTSASDLAGMIALSLALVAFGLG